MEVVNQPEFQSLPPSQIVPILADQGIYIASEQPSIESCTKLANRIIVVVSSLTLWGLGLGAIEELNPLMQLLIEKSPIAFMAVKLSLPVILGIIFWRIRNRSCKFVACSLGLVLIVYAVVMVLHVYWISNF